MCPHGSLVREPVDHLHGEVGTPHPGVQGVDGGNGEVGLVGDEEIDVLPLRMGMQGIDIAHVDVRRRLRTVEQWIWSFR